MNFILRNCISCESHMNKNRKINEVLCRNQESDNRFELLSLLFELYPRNFELSTILLPRRDSEKNIPLTLSFKYIFEFFQDINSVVVQIIEIDFFKVREDKSSQINVLDDLKENNLNDLKKNNLNDIKIKRCFNKKINNKNETFQVIIRTFDQENQIKIWFHYNMTIKIEFKNNREPYYFNTLLVSTRTNKDIFKNDHSYLKKLYDNEIFNILSIYISACFEEDGSLKSNFEYSMPFFRIDKKFGEKLFKENYTIDDIKEIIQSINNNQDVIDLELVELIKNKLFSMFTEIRNRYFSLILNNEELQNKFKNEYNEILQRNSIIENLIRNCQTKNDVDEIINNYKQILNLMKNLKVEIKEKIVDIMEKKVVKNLQILYSEKVETQNVFEIVNQLPLDQEINNLQNSFEKEYENREKGCLILKENIDNFKDNKIHENQKNKYFNEIMKHYYAPERLVESFRIYRILIQNRLQKYYLTFYSNKLTVKVNEIKQKYMNFLNIIKNLKFLKINEEMQNNFENKINEIYSCYSETQKLIKEIIKDYQLDAVNENQIITLHNKIINNNSKTDKLIKIIINNYKKIFELINEINVEIENPQIKHFLEENTKNTIIVKLNNLMEVIEKFESNIYEIHKSLDNLQYDNQNFLSIKIYKSELLNNINDYNKVKDHNLEIQKLLSYYKHDSIFKELQPVLLEEVKENYSKTENFIKFFKSNLNHLLSLFNSIYSSYNEKLNNTLKYYENIESIYEYYGQNKENDYENENNELFLQKTQDIKENSKINNILDIQKIIISSEKSNIEKLIGNLEQNASEFNESLQIIYNLMDPPHGYIIDYMQL